MKTLEAFTVRGGARITALHFLGEDRLVCGLDLPPLVVVSLPGGVPVASLNAKVHDTVCLSSSRDGQRLISGHGSWGGAQVWDLGQLTHLHELDESIMYVGAVRLADDGRALVAKGPMGWVFSASGERVEEPEDDGLKATPVALSPDGSLRCELVKTDVKLSPFPTGPKTTLGQVPGDHTRRGLVRFSADGALVAVGDNAGHVRVWRVADGALVRSLEGERGAVTGLDVSAARLLVLDSHDLNERLRVVTDAGVTNVQVEGDVLAVSPAGTRVAIGGASGTVTVSELA